MPHCDETRIMKDIPAACGAGTLRAEGAMGEREHGVKPHTKVCGIFTTLQCGV